MPKITYADYRRFCEGRYDWNVIWASWVNETTTNKAQQAAEQDHYLQSLVRRVWDNPTPPQSFNYTDATFCSILDYVESLEPALAYAALGDDYFA